MRFQIALAYHAYPDSHMFILWNLFAENIHMIFLKICQTVKSIHFSNIYEQTKLILKLHLTENRHFNVRE